MNKTNNIKYKSEQLNLLFNRALIKISLNTTNKIGYPLALYLVREEIQKIICISILIELNTMCHSFLRFSSKNIETQLLVDIIFRILLLSAKQKIALRLSILKQQKFIKLNFFNEWLLKDLESENYYLFMSILRSLSPCSPKKSSLNLSESLIENLIIKLSDILVYELFYNCNFSKIFLMEYTTDFLAIKKNLQRLKTYAYYKQIYEKICNFLKRTNNCNYLILICTKKGFKLKNLDSNYIQSSLTINQKCTPFLDKLNLLNS